LLGLLRITAEEHAESHLLILPPSPGSSSADPAAATRVYAGTIPARVGGEGVEFFGVRQYEMGDSARRINWRATARHPESVFSNEFQQERVADVAVVLDGRDRADLRVAGRALFDHAVVAAGTLASALLQQGNRVGLLVYSQYLQWTYPGYGRVQRERILHALANAAPGGSQIFEGLQYLPTRLFPPESQIVLVSPLVEDDLTTLVQLRARGYQVLVICPNPVLFEMSNLPALDPVTQRWMSLWLVGFSRLERTAMLGRLRRAGVQVIEWNVAHPFDLAMRGAFRRMTVARDKVTVLALIVSIVLGTGSLAWGYVGVGLPQIARWIVIFGAVWLIAVWQRWRWFAHLGLAAFFVAAALGLWFLNFPPGWMFAGAICALLAWT